MLVSLRVCSSCVALFCFFFFVFFFVCVFFCFFQAEDGIRDLVRSRGLGDVYKRQGFDNQASAFLKLLDGDRRRKAEVEQHLQVAGHDLSLIHI